MILLFLFLTIFFLFIKTLECLNGNEMKNAMVFHYEGVAKSIPK